MSDILEKLIEARENFPVISEHPRVLYCKAIKEIQQQQETIERLRKALEEIADDSVPFKLRNAKYIAKQALLQERGSDKAGKQLNVDG